MSKHKEHQPHTLFESFLSPLSQSWPLIRWRVQQTECSRQRANTAPGLTERPDPDTSETRGERRKINQKTGELTEL